MDKSQRWTERVKLWAGKLKRWAERHWTALRVHSTAQSSMVDIKCWVKQKNQKAYSVSSSLYLPYCFISSPPFSCVCPLKYKKKQELVKKLRYFLPQTYPSFLLQSLCPTKLFSLTDFQGYCKALYYRMRRCVCVFVFVWEWWWSWAWLFISSDVKCLMTSDVFLYFL